MDAQGTKFETNDRQGRGVRLRESVFDNHYPDRLEMADYLKEAQRTIEDPDIELEGDDGAYIYCSFGHGRGKHEKCFLKVYVYFRQGLGEVATYYLPTRVGPERVRWKKAR